MHLIKAANYKIAAMNTDMISYYKDRAVEYEKIYTKPERQADLLKATEILQSFFTGKDVMEIACGTGYWTERIATVANSILATDINEAVLNIARLKTYTNATVEFNAADMYTLPPNKKYQSLFGGFIWSHVKLQELDLFVNTINRLVPPGSTIVFMDNNYVTGSSLPVASKDELGNTYQLRNLENGTTHSVIKNFPSEKFIRNVLNGKATEIEFINLEYYWILKYTNI